MTQPAPCGPVKDSQSLKKDGRVAFLASLAMTGSHGRPFFGGPPCPSTTPPSPIATTWSAHGNVSATAWVTYEFPRSSTRRVKTMPA
jgi:hypothetical protein